MWGSKEITTGLNVGCLQPNVIEEGFDLVLRIGEIDDSRLSQRFLWRYQHGLVAAPAYLDKYGTPSQLSELQQHLCLRYRFPNSGKLMPWPLPDTAASLELPESAVSNDSTALLNMAEAGVGIALLPEMVVAESLAAGRLVRLFADQVQDGRDVYLLWPSGRHVLPKVRVFIDFMVERLGVRPDNPG